MCQKSSVMSHFFRPAVGARPRDGDERLTGFSVRAVLCSVEFAVPQWSLMHHASCSVLFARLREVFWSYVGCPSSRKLGSLGVQAVVCVVALFFNATAGDRGRALTPLLRASHRIFGSVSWLVDTCLAADLAHGVQSVVAKDTMSAIVVPTRKTDESASDVVGDGMVSIPMMPYRVSADPVEAPQIRQHVEW